MVLRIPHYLTVLYVLQVSVGITAVTEDGR